VKSESAAFLALRTSKMAGDIRVLVNGEAGDRIAALDRGFQYGDGLFETIAVAAGEPLLWERHVDRLARGAARLGIAMPPPALWRAEAEALCRGAQRAVLKLILTRGPAGRGYAPDGAGAPTRVLCRLPWPEYPATYAQQGVAVCFCETRLSRNPRLAGIKHLNRLEQVLARAELSGAFAEGLMTDESGQVIEGTMTNLFAVVDGVLRTPELSGCGVEGVMRAMVLERARELGIAVAITPLTRAELRRASEVFLTNSLIGLWPVQRVQDREYPIGEITRTVQAAIRSAHAGADAA
jgi:4-amino-4-deoxychorismate lyase